MVGEAEKVFHSQLYLLYTLDSGGQTDDGEAEEEEAHVEAEAEAVQNL